jgi:GNAT superfamily N-acetyltransferase
LSAVTVRAARRDDLEAIVACYAGDETAGHGDVWNAETAAGYLVAFDRMQLEAGNQLFVAELNGTVVGTYQLVIATGLTGRGRIRARMQAVFVLPALRGQGIGAAMVRHAIDEATRHGAGLIDLTSNAARTDAHRFYERLGFARSHAGFTMKLA